MVEASNQSDEPPTALTDLSLAKGTYAKSDADVEVRVGENMPQFVQLQNRKDMLKGFLLFMGSMVIDIGLPLGIYYGMSGHVSPIVALFVSSIPPLLFVIGKFIYLRKIDLMGCLFVFGFVLSGIFALASGDARLVLLRDSSITCVTGLCFLITLIPVRTKRIVFLPLSFYIFAQMLGGTERINWKDEQGNEFSLSKSDWMFVYVPWVRLYGYVSTVAWGVMLECEFIAKVIMIKSSLTIDQIVGYGNIVVAVCVCIASVISVGMSAPIRWKATQAWRGWQVQDIHPAPPAYFNRR